jgi:putative Mg2+ transporter-C (MgtC) family protein|tara:strand:- start:3029 stop:3499 length:471 start_codon:yes stop_codon:yes gene_type:complete
MEEIIIYINEHIVPLNIKSIGVAVLCSFVIGLERQIFGKPAGIRTSILICVGTYCFVGLSTSLIGTSTDTSRVVGQIVTGIGFLGAGLMFNNGALVQGVTSASIIWILAAVGSLVGFEFHGAAFLITGLTIIVLLGVTFLERLATRLKKGVHEDKS